MKNFQKAMLIKELLDENQIIGYHFKMKMQNFGIEVSNGSIYYHLKKFYQKDYVKKIHKDKTIIYVLTEKGKKELSKNIVTIPREIEHTFMLIASSIPSTNWNNIDDVKQFLERIEHVEILLNERIRELH